MLPSCHTNMLIRNTTILTQDSERRIVRNGNIHINNGIITAVSKDGSGHDNLCTTKVIDGTSLVALPGLVNAHVHLGDTIFSNFLENVSSLDNYIRDTNTIVTQSSSVERFRKEIATYTLLQMIKRGTTSVGGGRLHMYTESFGMCSVSGHMLMDSIKLGKFAQNLPIQYAQFAGNADLALTRPALFVHSLATVTSDMLRDAQNLRLADPSLFLMVHVAETHGVEARANSLFGGTSIETLHKFGLLNLNTLLIHGSNMTKSDKELVRKSGATLAHCLSSNLAVGDGTANIAELTKESGVQVCIATDGYATSKTYDVLEEARRCYKYHTNNSTKHELTCQDYLDMITCKAAHAIGFSNSIGSIEPGKRADLVLLKIKNNERDVVCSIIEGGEIEIAGVVIGGTLTVWNSALVCADEEKINSDYVEAIRAVERDLSASQ